MNVRSSLCLVTASIVISGLIAPVMLRAETYTFSFTITGSLNGVPFTDASGTLTATSDTVTGPIDDAFFAYVPSLSFSIEGVGSGVLIDTNPFVFDAPSSSPLNATVPLCETYGCVGFGDTSGPLAEFYSTSDIFNTYDLGTSIGPIPVQFPFTAGGSADTSAGILDVSPFSDVTFTAAPDATPEPSSLLLLGSGLAGLIGLLQRKRNA